VSKGVRPATWCSLTTPDVRAMILAAGFGTRLRPLTASIPKPLVTVLGFQLLEASMALLARAGVRRATVNMHHLPEVLGPQVNAAAARAGIAATLLIEDQILGTGGGLKNAESSLKAADAIVLINADTLLDVDLEGMIAGHLASGAAVTLLLRPNPDPVAYPPVETDAARRVVRIAGLPPSGASDATDAWLFAGVHILTPHVLSRLPAGVPSDVNRILHPGLIADGELVRGHVFHGPWWDIGTPERLLEANLDLLDAPAPAFASLAAERGMTVEGSIAHGRDTLIAEDVAVERAVLGHRVAVARGATIRNSVLFAGVTIGAAAKVTDCIIGPDVRVAAGVSLSRQLIADDVALPF